MGKDYRILVKTDDLTDAQELCGIFDEVCKTCGTENRISLSKHIITLERNDEYLFAINIKNRNINYFLKHLAVVKYVLSKRDMKDIAFEVYGEEIREFCSCMAFFIKYFNGYISIREMYIDETWIIEDSVDYPAKSGEVKDCIYDNVMESPIKELEFAPDMLELLKLYMAKENTLYNESGQAVIGKDDEWREETEWEDVYRELTEK